MDTNSSDKNGFQNDLPKSVSKLSWGAFWWSFIWGIFNNTWKSFLVIIFPGVMNIVLLFKGRKWAWKNKKWSSEENFEKIQKRWGLTGFLIIGIPTFLVFSIIIFNSVVSLYFIKAPEAAEKIINNIEYESSDLKSNKSNNEFLIDSGILEPVTVKVPLSGTGGSNFIKVSIGITIDDNNNPEMRNQYRSVYSKLTINLTEYLSNVKFEDIMQPIIKEKIKKEYFRYLNKLLPEAKLSEDNIKITEFLVQ